MPSLHHSQLILRLKYPRAASNRWCAVCCCPTCSHLRLGAAIIEASNLGKAPWLGTRTIVTWDHNLKQFVVGGSIQFRNLINNFEHGWNTIKLNSQRCFQPTHITYTIFDDLWWSQILVWQKDWKKNGSKLKHPHRTAEPLTPSGWNTLVTHHQTKYQINTGNQTWKRISLNGRD